MYVDKQKVIEDVFWENIHSGYGSSNQGSASPRIIQTRSHFSLNIQIIIFLIVQNPNI